MATITPRQNKDGSTVYRIRVSAGRKADGTQHKAFQTTWKPDPARSDRANKKALNEFAVKFEADCKAEFCRKSGLASATFRAILNGDNVSPTTAEKLSKALGMPVSALFTAENSGKTLSPKTVIRTHALISMILNEAVKDGIIASNPAERARLPKAEKHEAEFLSPDELTTVLTAADLEPSKIRLFVYLLAASGGRRGEVVGLLWRDVNFMFGQIHFEQTVLYRKNRGIYTDTPKNEKSDRFLKLPPEIMQMLTDYKQEWERVKEECGTLYPDKIKLPNGSGKMQEQEADFIFIQTKRLGFPMNPDTTNGWLRKLSDKNGLKPLHPHMFRHSAALTLIYAGVDVVSVAGYLGHADPTTTQNIYSHALQEAQNRNAEIIGSAIFSRKKPLPNDENGNGKKVV